jgi:hypothetical protein
MESTVVSLRVMAPPVSLVDTESFPVVLRNLSHHVKKPFAGGSPFGIAAKMC